LFVLHSAKKLIGIFVKGVETQFIPNPEENQNAGGHSDRKPSQVDKGISLMPFDFTEGDFKIIFEYDRTPYE